MRPLVHPAIADVTVAGILHAMADPVRVAIYAEIAGSSCSQKCSMFSQIRDRTIPKSTLSQHFRILREAGLVRGERHGVEMRNSARCEEINQRFPGLLAAIVEAHAREQAGTPEKKRRRGAARPLARPAKRALKPRPVR